MKREKQFTEEEIREVLQRRYSSMPALSGDFCERVLAAHERQQRRGKVRRLILWPSIAAAAAVALLLVLNMERPATTHLAQHTETPASISDPEKMNNTTRVEEEETPAAEEKVRYKPKKRVSSPPIKKEVPAVAEQLDEEIESPSAAPQEEAAPDGTPPFPLLLYAHRDEMRQRMAEEYDIPSLVMTNINHDEI